MASASQIKTNLVLRRQLFSWREVESTDYPTYIANLRQIGCPESTVRDIIIAEVNTLFARKRAIELVTPGQQWWRSVPDTNVVQAAAEKARELDEERRALLTRLLGPNWESGDMVSLPRPSRPGVMLDGPLLGNLAPDIKQAIQDINTRSQARMQAYVEAQKRDGKNPDPVELAKLRQQTRNELARVLSPAQFEEFLLRYSQEANDLRTTFGQLQFFDPTSPEFRAVFRATDALDQQIQSLTGNDPAVDQQRRALEDQRENAIRTALGPERYQEYLLLQDPLYRKAVAIATAAGTPEAVQTIYAINQAAAAQQTSIRIDPNLTSSQKNIELKRLELDQLRANAVATGQELPPEPSPPSPPMPKRTYVLRQGDSVAVVSMIYGMPIGAIQQANPNVDLSKLKPGDALVISPAATSSPNAP
jgi:LysM repeat protein